MSSETEIKPLYKILIETLNEHVYEEKLLGDPDLFVDKSEWDSQSSLETGLEDDKGYEVPSDHHQQESSDSSE